MAGGIASSVFATVSRALIADLTTPGERVKVFSLQNLAFNIGWGIGPVIGVLFGLAASQLPFIITGAVFAVYAAGLGIVLKAYKFTEQESQVQEKTSMKESFQAMGRDRALLLFVVAGMVMAVGWAQFPILLSQFVTSTFDKGTQVFGVLLIINAVVIVIFQLPVSRWAERKRPINSLLLGVMLASAGLAGFGMSVNMAMLIAAISLISLAETLVNPISNVILDEISPDKMKGAYFGAQNIGMLGMFLSPILGGFLLEAYGGRTMYFVLSVICASSMILFFLSYRVYSNRNGQVKAMVYQPAAK